MFSFVEYIPVPYALVAAWKPCVYSPHNLTKEVQEWDNLYLRGTRSFLKKQRPFKGLDEEDTYETKAQALKLRIERKKATRGVGRYIPRALSEEDRVQELRKRAKDELDLYMAGSIASIDQKLDELIAKTDTNGLYVNRAAVLSNECPCGDYTWNFKRHNLDCPLKAAGACGNEELEHALLGKYEKIEFHRQLVQQHPGHTRCLANSLNEMAQLLWSAGRRDEAFAYSQEAVDLYGSLVHMGRNSGPLESTEGPRSLSTLG